MSVARQGKLLEHCALVSVLSICHFYRFELLRNDLVIAARFDLVDKGRNNLSDDKPMALSLALRAKRSTSQRSAAVDLRRNA